MDILHFNNDLVSFNGRFITKPVKNNRNLYFQFVNPAVNPKSVWPSSAPGVWAPYESEAGIWSWSTTGNGSDYRDWRNQELYRVLGTYESRLVDAGIYTSDVTNMEGLFSGCDKLLSVEPFNTSGATDMSEMFRGCESLETVPLLDTSSVTDVFRMFYACRNVESGALALYNQMSSQATPPSSHSRAFENCGVDTVTGAAELAQIPSGWK